jgi:S-methylmethionine-dependent homocysteine/selenocysteine methylase
MNFIERLAQRRPILLDGATGTELARRGVDITGPLWSAQAIRAHPDRLGRVHADYVAAGAEVITANTFRTNARAAGPQAEALTAEAVAIARASGARWVAGSIAPIEDCYRPDLAPPDPVARTQHDRHARHLADAGVALLLIETMNTIREAKIAREAARLTGLPTLVSFVCRGDGTLLSGEPIEEAARAVADADAILVNCMEPASISDVLRRLRAATSRPIGAYGNILTSRTAPDLYARFAREWVGLGAAIVGGCCGTTPAHIKAVADELRAIGGSANVVA